MLEQEKTRPTHSQQNIQKWGMDIHLPVFLVSVIAIILFVMGTISFPESAKEIFEHTKEWSISNFDWFFVVSCNIFVVFSVALLFLPVGKIRLGGKSAKPEFSTISWLSLLFAAGMGIGLMFWSVAEPVAYYTDWWGTPLNVDKHTPEGAKLAIGSTMFHWGIHPWAIYAVVGLALAFFSFNKQLPLTMRSAFYPIMKGKSWGVFGHIVDITAVFATIFGLATSLGFGAKQVAAGLTYLFGIPNSLDLQIVIILVITTLALLSVVRGLNRGVKVLSNINMGLALALLLFLIIIGYGFSFFSSVMTTTTSYLEYIIPLSNWLDRSDEKFYHGWTVFYWAWWISWSPFVGMFIARISKGRTVREFIFSVLLVPTLLSIIWMSAFGGLGLNQVQTGVGQLANGLTDVSLALFHMLDALPFSYISSTIAMLLVVVFFVTSSDSGSLVVSNITAGGKLNSPTPQRVFWAVIQGLTAIALLYAGGEKALGALQAAAITVGLPLTLILLLMCFTLYLGLKKELKENSNS